MRYWIIFSTFPWLGHLKSTKGKLLLAKNKNKVWKPEKNNKRENIYVTRTVAQPMKRVMLV